MPRTATKVTQADVARVLRAVKQSGLSMAVEISQDGKIRLEPVDAGGGGKVDTRVQWVP